ncbi:MAG: protein-glutamate O-methyltransferase CheR [Balneolaceae bacterium]|nr:protein-glutamate O-methyltransferase CheR [Balneolaceae bacterium]
MSLTALKSITAEDTLSKYDFERVRKIIFDYCGIDISPGKEALVQSRLTKRLRSLGITEYGEYLDLIESSKPKGEFLSFVDVLTTNKTSFYRENKHFEFIEKNIFPTMQGRSVKWWSAGCSSGEEPTTLAMNLLEAERSIRYRSVKILATDISRDVLHVAKSGTYASHKVNDIPVNYLNKYLTPQPDGSYKVKDRVRNMITYGRLNLNDRWPLKGDFQMIMCRNVMIYFNRQTQEQIISKFRDLLEPNGYVFLGHSESMNAPALGFKNVAPAVYQKL